MRLIGHHADTQCFRRLEMESCNLRFSPVRSILWSGRLVTFRTPVQLETPVSSISNRDYRRIPARPGHEIGIVEKV